MVQAFEFARSHKTAVATEFLSANNHAVIRSVVLVWLSYGLRISLHG